MKDKGLLIKAIDKYDLLQPPSKAVLKTLVAAAKEDNTVCLSITSIAKLSKISRQGTYNIIYSLEKEGTLTRSKKHRISIFTLSPEKLEEFINYFETLNSVKNILQGK